MKDLLKFALLTAVFASHTAVFAQAPDMDKGSIKEYKNEYWESIKESVDEFESADEEPRMKFIMDFDGYELPESKDIFTQYWHNDPVSQGWSGMCWCFSTTSFLESEAYRIHGIELKISELHTVYWEYVEKARRYVKERGKSLFAEGSQANAVIRIWKKYGCVPAEIYTGKKEGQEHHGHSKMFHEMKSYLESLKRDNAWNERIALSTIRSILDNYIGVPPENFKLNGKTITPQEYLENIVRLDLDDYIDIMSLKEKAYWEKAEYEVPDNWWHSDEYYNVPLDDFMDALKNSIENGYTLFIGGDVSESGYNSHAEVAMVPSYDIPSGYIDENARQFRFSNKSTTDDHGIHMVGYEELDGTTWFLIKDSGSGSRNGKNKGYYFYHEDYVKLKMMNFMVHRSAIERILENMKK